MSKKIRLTESQIKSLVGNVISEQRLRALSNKVIKTIKSSKKK